MTFINDNVLPVKFAKCALVVKDVLVGRDDDVELLVLQELGQLWSFVLLAFVGDDTNGRGPLLELINPILDGDKGNYDQEWSFIALVTNQVGEQGDCLYRLAKTHFVG